jgi:hypothetical protein
MAKNVVNEGAEAAMCKAVISQLFADHPDATLINVEVSIEARIHKPLEIEKP